MELKDWFEQEILPCVRADGGWLELREGREQEERQIPNEAETVRLTVRGECVHCAALERCLRWAEDRAMKELGRTVRFTAVREPFIWRR